MISRRDRDRSQRGRSQTGLDKYEVCGISLRLEQCFHNSLPTNAVPPLSR
jgi:hypothetical protein